MPDRPLILICDDDLLLLDLLEFKLTARGYRVVRASDGEVAKQRLQEERPAAAILDGMVPIFDGFEILRFIREDAALQDLPVLMLTARKQERDILTAFEIGASDYIVKPFNPDELVARLARLLRKPQ
jgi:DNA-binding response OmpR family regulator